MATSLIKPVIHQLRRTVLLPDGAGLTDGQLVNSFVSQSDQAAFEVLVRRHGPMVLGVCRRVLRNHHDAEDAFQATFLVLVRKAICIVPREMVANWLYGVAYRTALKARSMIAKQRMRERQVRDMPEPEAAEPDHRWRDLQPLLDQELSRLPDKYRVPVVLCDLEGKTGKDAARQLGWPEGTVASRLSRGRGMLAKRLTRHGLALSSGSLAVALAENASACVPASLASATIKAASLLAAGQGLTTGLVSVKVAALTEGMVKAMLLTKFKVMVGVLLVVAAVIGGAAGLINRTHAEKVAKTAIAAQPKTDYEKLQGTWRLVSCTDNGQEPLTKDQIKEQERAIIIKNDTTTEEQKNFPSTNSFKFKLDESKKPKTIDAFDTKEKDKVTQGIYSLQGDTLQMCFAKPGEKRPTEFTSKAGSGWNLLVYQRDKKAVPNGKKTPDEKKPLVQGNPILSSDEFLGKWTGEKNGIKVELTFTGKQAAWGKNAVWKLEHSVARKPKIPQQAPTVLVVKGVDLKCVPDVKAGCLNLYLPKYLGDDKEIKKIPALNGLAPVGEIKRGAEGTILLRIIPTGYEKFAPEDEFPAVEGLILHRVAEPMEAPDEKKPPDQDQAKQILDMVLKGFQAYHDSKTGGDQDQNSVNKDMEKLQGTWRVVSSQVGDEKAAEDEIKKRKVTVKGDLLTYECGNELKEKREGTIKLDPKTQAIDWIITWPEKGTMLGIYELKGDVLKIGFGNDGLVRPRQFVMGKENVVWLLVLKREKP